MRIAILVSHLLGTGHLKRASLIADGIVEAGHEAVVISGGLPAPNANPARAEMIQIPPVRTDSVAFTGLIDSEGNVAGEALMRARSEAIRCALAEFRPQLFVTELFPFGRRKLADEFLAAIDEAGDALIFSSVRDILQLPKKRDRIAQANERFATLYDGAFFHGSEDIVPLEKSWPISDDLKTRVLSTGYIGEDMAPHDPAGDGTGEIVVSAGGGPVGARLFAAAMDAQRYRRDGRTWRLLVGGHDKRDRIDALKAQTPADARVIVESVRPDFRKLLARCDMAILRCGYNTALDVVATGARALFCPFEEGETEQRLRAESFAQQFGSGVVAEDGLTGDILSKAVDATFAAPPPDYSAVKLNGIEGTVQLATRLIAERFGPDA